MLWSFPDVVSGLLGQPAVPGAAIADNVDTIKALNAVSAVGGVLLALGGRRLRRAAWSSSTRRHDLPGDDPWDGHTLEWATSSPPPVGNFASLPTITSEAPLYDARHQPEEADA